MINNNFFLKNKNDRPHGTGEHRPDPLTDADQDEQKKDAPKSNRKSRSGSQTQH